MSVRPKNEKSSHSTLALESTQPQILKHACYIRNPRSAPIQSGMLDFSVRIINAKASLRQASQHQHRIQQQVGRYSHFHLVEQQSKTKSRP